MRIFAGIALAFAASGAFASGFQPSDDDLRVQQGRQLLAREFPEVMRHMARQDGFGGPSSKPIARAMLSDAPDLVAEAKAKMTVEKIEDGVWLIHFPYVNVALIETRHGLVLFDTGYAAIGPVLVELLPALSKKPLSHIIVSHTHVDHAYGWPALKAKWPMAKMITSALLPEMAARDVRLGGSIGRLNNQPLHLQPASIDQMPTPDIVFEDKLSIQIDGETFRSLSCPGGDRRTNLDGGTWPARRFSPQLLSGFLPMPAMASASTAHVDEWVAALRDMSAKKPEVLMPMHGAAIVSEAKSTQADHLAEAFAICV
ncbi:MAG: MBL fold metallo-hydrolase [Sphingomonadales bacterium]|nr:MBL fold metallo-hydrolase [Sphingomonadales bacterium]